MARALGGLLRGSIITLDDGIPPLDGQRVRVLVEPEEKAAGDATVDNRRLWLDWVARGPQGPLDDDDSFPPDA